MLIPTAATAGILALAFGGAIIAQPGSGPSAVPGAAVDATASPMPTPEPAPPTVTEVSAVFRFGPDFGTFETTEAPGLLSERSVDGYWRVTQPEPFDDERLQGDVYTWGHMDRFTDGGPTVWNGGFSIVNAEGAWHAAAGPVLDFADGTRGSVTALLVGEGAYDGHYLIADFTLEDDRWTVAGYIIEGEPLPAIEPPAAIRPAFEAP